MTSTGNLFIISASSGTGKTSLTRELAETLADIKCSVSYTTRPPRSGEQEGIDYFFVSKDKFKEMIEHNAFLEYADIYDNQYGTSRNHVEKILQVGIDVILEIDWQGAKQIRDNITTTASIFILPPLRKTLRERMLKRSQDEDDVIERRLNAAATEVKHYSEYDYLVVNDDFNEALTDLQAIIKAYRCRQKRQAKKLGRLLHDLMT